MPTEWERRAIAKPSRFSHPTCGRRTSTPHPNPQHMPHNTEDSQMRQFANYLGRLPLAGRLFRPALHEPAPAPTPALICRREPVLAGSDLFRSFGTGETKSYALKGVSVEFNPGELNLLMGPSGSGKSTLLAVLSGLLRPDTGVVGALGRDGWQRRGAGMERSG